MSLSRVVGRSRSRSSSVKLSFGFVDILGLSNVGEYKIDIFKAKTIVEAHEYYSLLFLYITYMI